MLVFLYDGSFEGLLTSIYDGFYSKVPPSKICTHDKFEADLLSEVIAIDTNKEKVQKVQLAISSKIDPLCLNKIYKVYLSNYNDKEIICFKYLKLAFKLGSDVHKHLHLELVKNIDLINKRVSLEAHRFTGFVRFNSINNSFLYASIEPDNDILQLISDHFKRRFSNENWIIHDVNRQIASIYNKISWEIVEMSKEDYLLLSNHDDDFSSLWKDYFTSTTIKERLNPKLQKRSMPKRYWKHLTETK